jgi:hypothetical protein
MSVAERWEKERRNFSVLQWVDCFKQLKEEEQKKEETKVLTVLQLIEARIGWPATAHAPSRRTTTRTQSRMSYANA